MEIVEIVERPKTFEAVQFKETSDTALIEWCEGRLTAYDGQLMLHIYDCIEKRWVTVEPGSWIIKKHFNSFQSWTDEAFKKHFMGAPA